MHVAIIGNGVTGVSAAIQLRKLQPSWKITLISGESTHHYSRPALMYIFMGHMRYQDTKPYEDHFWAEQRLDLLRDWVTAIDVENKTLKLHKHDNLAWDKLLIATGSKSNRFGWKGQDLEGVQGLWDLMDLRKLYDNTKNARQAAIVGGGLIGIEMAEMLHSRNIHVTFLVREKSYWDNVLPAEESGMLNGLIRAQGMDLRLETNLVEIVDDGKGRACAVRTDRDAEIPAQVVGLTAGVSPNVDLLKDTPIETGRGALVDWSLQTNIPDVYAAGDCAELVTPESERNTIQQVWYTGKQQGRLVADVMAGEDKKYEPGIWYNSAKFLDLEYQTYGRVGFRVPDEESLVWQHPDRTCMLRLVHVNKTIIGFNLMGIRYRHEVCERWLAEERSVEYVLEHLSEANFDPEFYTRYEAQIQSSLRRQLQ